MKAKVRFLGLDVHAATTAVAVAEPDGSVRSLGTIANRAESIRTLVKKLGPVEQLRACYEAGPTGYVLYWQLAELGVACEVIAPTLVPTKAGDRVKTDRRDAEKPLLGPPPMSRYDAAAMPMYGLIRHDSGCDAL
jgi:transposase